MAETEMDKGAGGEAREFLLLALLGARVRKIAAEATREVPANGSPDPLVRLQAVLGSPAVDPSIEREAEEILARYDDDTFWHELIHRLGERDFERRATDEEIREIETADRYPERVSWQYDHWEKEFADHGIDRLAIDDGEFIEEERV